jgi:hypothetical protein
VIILVYQARIFVKAQTIYISWYLFTISAKQYRKCKSESYAAHGEFHEELGMIHTSVNKWSEMIHTSASFLIHTYSSNRRPIILSRWWMSHICSNYHCGTKQALRPKDTEMLFHSYYSKITCMTNKMCKQQKQKKLRLHQQGPTKLWGHMLMYMGGIKCSWLPVTLT